MMKRTMGLVLVLVMMIVASFGGDVVAQGDLPSDAAIRLMERIDEEGMAWETLTPAGEPLTHVYPTWGDGQPLSLAEWAVGYYDVWGDCLQVVVDGGRECRYVRLLDRGQIGRYRLFVVVLTDEGRVWAG